MPRPQNISRDEIQAAFLDEPTRANFPPILTPEQFAALFGISKATFYDWVAKGYLDGAITKVGKHLRIWRNRAIEIAFSRRRTKGNQPIGTDEPRD